MEAGIESDVSRVAEFAHSLERAVGTVFVGSPLAVRFAVMGLLSGLHVLVEDIPGVGRPPSRSRWRGPRPGLFADTVHAGPASGRRARH
jgi:hypothetical protein